MQIDVAVVGATGLVGEAILEQLVERRFPIRRIFALGEGESRGKRVAYGERRLVVEAVGELDFARTRIVFCCPGTDRSTADRARQAGAVLVDSAGLYWGDATIPLVAPAVNPGAIRGVAASGVVTLPDAPAAQLAEALAPLAADAGLERVDVVTCRSVSVLGRQGLEELAHQTAQLLNAHPVKPALFPAQIAFNLLGEDGTVGPDGMTESERLLVGQVRRLLDAPIEVCATTMVAPVFHGDAQAVHVQTRVPIRPEQARSLWRSCAGIRIAETEGATGGPTPVTDAACGDALVIGRIRSSPGPSPGLQFWTVADGVRHGRALNSVQIAEILVKAHL